MGNTVREMFESIGFEYTKEVYGINFNKPCYEMVRNSTTITVCESENAVGFDFLFQRMVQPIHIAYHYFKAK